MWLKNQYACGSDWAMAAVADVEGARFLATGQLDDLSVQQLVACDPGNSGCQGGYTFRAFQYVEQFGGVVLDSDYGYKGICTTDECDDVSHDTPVCEKQMVNEAMKRFESAPVGGWQMVAMGAAYESDLMKLALLRNGPLAAVMNANGMEHYIHGVVGCDADGDCEAGNVDHHAMCDSAALDHSALVVGYGKDEGMAYWILKNSWGTEWGEDGFARIVTSANTGPAGTGNNLIETECTYATPDRYAYA